MDLYERKQLRYKHICITVAITTFAVVLTAILTFIYCGGRGSLSTFTYLSKEVQDKDSPAGSTIAAISESLKSFRTVIDMFYIGDIDEEKLLDGAIKGYVDGLDDEYSEYMTKEEWDEFQLSALGTYVGIGVYMNADKNGNAVVTGTIEDAPAEKAGIKQEDVIVEVDGEDVRGRDSAIVASKVKGEAGTKVHIKILRQKEYKEFDIKREEIKVYHVTSKMLENNIGYISLLTFDTGCKDEVEKAIKDLEAQGATKFILDVRYNGGGIVGEALDIANLFLPKGKDTLITVSAGDDRKVNSTEKNNITDAPLVVLINEYSASSTEILVAALKDHDRAQLVGTTTYGKGVIQNVFTLKDGSVLKLTSAEYFTPKGTKINKVGVAPDFEVELPDVKDEKDFVDTQLEKAKELLK